MGILRRFSSKDPEQKCAMSSARVGGGEENRQLQQDIAVRHPLLALEALRKVCRGTMIFPITTPGPKRVRELPGVSHDVQLYASTLLDNGFPSMKFVEGRLDGDVTCWFIPNVEGVAAALRSCGFTPRELVFPPNVQEVFVRCTVD